MDNIEQNNVQDKINEMIAELSESREDSRCTQNQIFEIINIVGTILGVLFGASYLSSGDKNQNFDALLKLELPKENWLHIIVNPLLQIITPARLVFWLSALAFMVAFLYIIYLGIENILRYYHIQNIEDRLYDLIPNTQDNQNRGTFLHWDAFSAPVLTKNIRHVTSTHTVLAFFAYVGAVISIILFSLGVVLSLFFEIAPIRFVDKLILSIIIMLMFFTVVLFWRLSILARDVVQFSWDMAHENQRIRLGIVSGRVYAEAKSFNHLLKYLIYPKTQDLQKPLLIVIGWLCWIFYTHTKIRMIHIIQLISVMFLFDFLAYQARYQINDIRGIKEDKEAGHKNRLLFDEHEDERHVIKVSFMVAAGRIMLSVFLAILYCRRDIWLPFFSLLILFVSTLVYETARAKNLILLIFVSVGFGYPLRFFLGLLAFAPGSTFTALPVSAVYFLLAFCAYGSFSSTLAWANEITDRIQKRYDQNETQIYQTSYEKKHYLYIQNVIKDRFEEAKLHSFRGKVLPLRERNKLTDPWNAAYIFSVCMMLMTAFTYKLPFIWRLSECGILICAILSIYLKNRKKLIPFCAGLGLMVIKVAVPVKNFEFVTEYMILSIAQIVVTCTYIILSYRPQFKKMDLKVMLKNLLKTIMRKILGEYAASILNR